MLDELLCILKIMHCLNNYNIIYLFEFDDFSCHLEILFIRYWYIFEMRKLRQKFFSGHNGNRLFSTQTFPNSDPIFTNNIHFYFFA